MADSNPQHQEPELTGFPSNRIWVGQAGDRTGPACGHGGGGACILQGGLGAKCPRHVGTLVPVGDTQHPSEPAWSRGLLGPQGTPEVSLLQLELDDLNLAPWQSQLLGCEVTTSRSF